MEKFELHILGCGSALPTTRHFATSQVVNVRDKLYMIDCGEGSQLQFRKSRLKFSRLNHIFISHLHGDHCFGLYEFRIIQCLNPLSLSDDIPYLGYQITRTEGLGYVIIHAQFQTFILIFHICLTTQ